MSVYVLCDGGREATDAGSADGKGRVRAGLGNHFNLRASWDPNI